MSSKGYGRRRRALEDATEIDLQMERTGESSEAGRQLCRVKTPCIVAWMAKENSCWGYLPTADEKVPAEVLLKKCAEEQLLRVHNPAEGDSLRSLWMKARFQNRYCWCRLRFSFHWFNQINDSSQISLIWQECLSLGSWHIRLSITITFIPASWSRNRVCNAKGGSYKWTECMFPTVPKVQFIQYVVLKNM